MAPIKDIVANVDRRLVSTRETITVSGFVPWHDEDEDTRGAIAEKLTIIAHRNAAGEIEAATLRDNDGEHAKLTAAQLQLLKWWLGSVITEEPKTICPVCSKPHHLAKYCSHACADKAAAAEEPAAKGAA